MSRASSQLTGYDGASGRGWSRTVVGTVGATELGDYTVTAGLAVEGVEPKILLGR